MVMRRNTPTIRFITLEHDPQKLNQSAAGTVRFTEKYVTMIGHSKNTSLNI